MSAFTATAAEQNLVAQIFQHAEAKDNILRGDIAVSIFGGAKLQPAVLREIWSLADEENNGWLSRKGVAIALRLMGWAQRGEPITAALIAKPGALPSIEGITAVVPQSTGFSVRPSPSTTTGLPPLTPADKAKYLNMFQKAGPSNGLLSGEQARDIFVKSKLSNEVLLEIWNLADTKDRGSLDAVDFAVGMYFIQGAMSGQIPSIPSSLPPGLYQQAGGSSTGSIRSHTTGNSGSFSPVTSAFPQARVQPQYTGQSHLVPEQPTGNFGYSKPPPPPIPARPNPSQIGSGVFGTVSLPWDVTPAEKANSDRLFDTLDVNPRKGYIEGEVAVPFMLESKLPGEVLAQIWDLADLTGDGRLTRDGFAVAMHLIQKKLAGVEVPNTLPPTLVPPSMRAILANGTSPFSPPGSHPQVHQQPAPAPAPAPTKDLFSWDDSPPAAAAPLPPVTVQTTGVTNQQTGPQQSNAFVASQPAFRSTGDPFGSSTFGAPAAAKDLLDDDDVAAAPLHDHSAEIGNTQNQLNSTNRSLETAKNDRATVEQALASQASQLSSLQTQLSLAKASYETETSLLATLRDRLTGQTADIQSTRQQLITAESDLSAIRMEKAEIEGAFLRDKEEARDLHRKMVEAGQQVEATKLEVEKAKKDAKQQKGLLAIARKQLSTKEAERAKVQKELEAAQAEAALVTKEKEEVDAELEKLDAPAPAPPVERALSSESVSFAAGFALPATPDPSSPSIASMKSNNPFERLTGASTPRPQSPLVPFTSPGQSPPTVSQEPAEVSLDDPFGLGQSSQATATSEPETTKVIPNGDDVNEGPKESPQEISVPPTSATVFSPSESDFFSTPLTTAATSPVVNGHEKQSTIDGVVAKFPELDEPSPMPGHFSPDESHATDLAAGLKEIEVEESDSDSDSDDEVPLSEVKAKAIEQADTNGTAPDNPSATTFDDIFGENTTSAPSQPVESATDVFGIPNAAAPTVAGVSAFDEAMGTLPTSAPTSAAPFTFETAFDDTFDFSSATSSAFPPAPTANGAVTSPLASTPNPVKLSDGFETLFTQPNGSSSNGQSAPIVPEASVPVVANPIAGSTSGPSFDEAFASFDSTPKLELDPSSGTTSKAPDSPKPFPVANSPAASPRTNRPSSSPPRTKSPPPRTGTASPKPKSSKDEKPKEPPAPRHSKLSIRLPFGKKKKQQPEPLPPPSQLLTPPQEEPDRTTSPAVEDDVESVKQLTAMGFSRSQAIAALEKYGYDVPRALNSLLAG